MGSTSLKSSTHGWTNSAYEEHGVEENQVLDYPTGPTSKAAEFRPYSWSQYSGRRENKVSR